MLHDLLERQATEHPEGRALVWEGSVLTWLELRRKVDALADRLAAEGLGSGQRVLLAFHNGPALVVAYLALARRGAVALPLDPEEAKSKSRFQLPGTGCDRLLAGDSCVPLAERWLEKGFLSRAWIVSSTGEISRSLKGIAERSGDAIQPAAQSGHGGEFLELFTSGTTGLPKRVVRTQGQLVRLASAYVAALGLSCQDRILAVIPLTHGHGICSCLLAALQSGACLVLQERFEPRRSLRLLEEHHITVFPAVGFVFRLLAECVRRQPVDLSSLRIGLTGGAPLPRETWDQVREALGVSLRQSYGSSETGAIAVNLDPDAEGTSDSVGRPLEGVEVGIVDEQGRPVPVGQVGEILVRGPGAAEWAFLPDTDSAPGRRVRLTDSEGWISTDDLGCLDEAGRLRVIRRKAGVLSVAGRKVNIREVEAVLLRMPQVLRARVVAVRDRFGEEGVKALLTTSGPCPAEEVIRVCREHLSAHEIPRSVEIRREP